MPTITSPTKPSFSYCANSENQVPTGRRCAIAKYDYIIFRFSKVTICSKEHFAHAETCCLAQMHSSYEVQHSSQFRQNSSLKMVITPAGGDTCWDSVVRDFLNKTEQVWLR
ncbi:hypothetical protein T4B_9798 [Trichinella pseudospiralis]|uniref:Uncharacterized protein n=1 Tax=Trichinella pseudospiralis TaxID=6337 RepID=A0A0V1HJA9_TRIPS|nr:hypothetical protein T4B_9798 [Trichinella pseudospiralis]